MVSGTRSDPPFLEHYTSIIGNSINAQRFSYDQLAEILKEFELPLIDLEGLRNDDEGKRQAIMEAMGKASS